MQVLNCDLSVKNLWGNTKCNIDCYRNLFSAKQFVAFFVVQLLKNAMKYASYQTHKTICKTNNKFSVVSGISDFGIIILSIVFYANCLLRLHKIERSDCKMIMWICVFMCLCIVCASKECMPNEKTFQILE